MGDQRAQPRREARQLQPPVLHQRGGHHQQVHARLVAALEHGEQGDDLDRLAQAHVVGQAAAQAQAPQGPEPLHAGFLIGPQRAVQAGARLDVRHDLGRAQRLELRLEPASCHHLGPCGTFVGLIAFGDVQLCPGEQAHGLGEAHAARQGLGPDLAPLVEHLAELVGVRLDPAALDEHQPCAGPQQGLQLSFAQGLAPQGELDAEVQQRVEAQHRGPLVPHRHRHHRAGASPGAPPVGQAQHQARPLEGFGLAQKGVGRGRGPGQGVVDLAGLQHVLDERAVLGCALQWGEQRHQLAAPARTGVLSQGAAQGHVLDLLPSRDMAGVGGDEGEGVAGIALVLGQVQADAARQVPDRIAARQEALEVAIALGGALGQRLARLRPQPLEQRQCDALGAAHGGRLGRQRRERCGVGFGQAQGLGGQGNGLGAGGGHQQSPQLAPPGQARVQRRAQLGRAEVKQAMARAPCEGLLDAVGGLGGQRERAVGIVVERHPSAGGQGGDQIGRHGSGGFGHGGDALGGQRRAWISRLGLGDVRAVEPGSVSSASASMARARCFAARSRCPLFPSSDASSVWA